MATSPNKQSALTKAQIARYNRMLRTLNRIAKDYQTPNELRRKGAEQIGLSYSEALEMSYENIQQEAKQAVKGAREI